MAIRPRKRRSSSRGRSASSRKRQPTSRSRRPSRKRRRIGLLLAVVAALALGGFAASQDAVQELLPDRGVAAGPEGPRSGTGVDAERAHAQLAELTVAEWASMSGYSRDRFSHWRTVDGCDVRQTVLARDGEDIETETDSCRVVSGSWFSPFDGETLIDPGDIDIDHIVPLANAWRTGAAEWDDDRRAEFANDLTAPQLIAVSASSNRAKGDQDPSQWQPDRDYWCRYAHDWVAVKHSWQLSVTEPERDALAGMLDTCG